MSETNTGPGAQSPLPPLLATVGLPADLLPGGTNVGRLAPMLEEPEVVARIKRDTMPVPPTNLRIGYYGQEHLAYWLSGLDDLRRLRSMLGDGIEGPILDFGAASGRIARHWAMEPENFEVAACDTTAHILAWLEHHGGSRINAVNNKMTPPLPFADGTFGVVSAYSVFSHIFEREEEWLAEIRRVTKPGAHIALTIHSEVTWDMLPTLPFPLREQLELIPEYVAMREANAPLPDRLHFERGGVDYAFYSNKHIHEVWGRYFDVVEIVDRGHIYQSMVIMRRPA